VRGIKTKKCETFHDCEQTLHIRTLGNLSIHKVLVLSTPTVYPKTAGTYSYPLRLLMCKKTRTLYLFHASTNEELRFGGVVPRAT
jgi:hypothetical protein